MVNSSPSIPNTRLINESFDMLGQWVVSVHAKDLRWQRDMNIHFVECPLGEGVLDYVTWLKRMATLPNDVPLMIEHMKDQAEYQRCRDHLFKVSSETGVGRARTRVHYRL